MVRLLPVNTSAKRASLKSPVRENRTPGSVRGCPGQPGVLPRYIEAYLDSNGAPAAVYQYDAFGNLQSGGGNEGAIEQAKFSHRFSTKFQDGETGIVYYGYRYYQTELGRWMSRDPIEEDGGINLFSFALNQATFRIDRRGEDSLIVGERPVADSQLTDWAAEDRRNNGGDYGASFVKANRIHTANLEDLATKIGSLKDKNGCDCYSVHYDPNPMNALQFDIAVSHASTIGENQLIFFVGHGAATGEISLAGGSYEVPDFCEAWGCFNNPNPNRTSGVGEIQLKFAERLKKIIDSHDPNRQCKDKRYIFIYVGPQFGEFFKKPPVSIQPTNSFKVYQ